MSGSIGDAAADLRRIARDASDASGYFPALYARVTGRLADAIAHARRQAWGAAERLRSLDRSGRQAYGGELDRLVSVLAYLVSRPPVPLRPLAWLARRLEQRDPGAVVDALLGER